MHFACEEMLANIAQHYLSEVDKLVSNMSSLLEPAIMLILGILTGILVIALYIPIFNMGQIL